MYKITKGTKINFKISQKPQNNNEKSEKHINFKF